VLSLEDPQAAASSAASRVQGVDPHPGGFADFSEAPGGLTPVAGPLMVLTPDALERLAAAASSSPAASLGELVAALEPGNVAHRPVYAMPLDCFFSLRDGYSLQLTSNFFAYYALERSGGKGEAARALEAARRLAALQDARTAAGGSLAGAVKLMSSADAARPAEPVVDGALRAVFLAFWKSWTAGDRHVRPAGAHWAALGGTRMAALASWPAFARTTPCRVRPPSYCRAASAARRGHSCHGPCGCGARFGAGGEHGAAAPLR
jgi:hypothetical protein